MVYFKKQRYLGVCMQTGIFEDMYEDGLFEDESENRDIWDMYKDEILGFMYKDWDSYGMRAANSSDNTY